MIFKLYIRYFYAKPSTKVDRQFEIRKTFQIGPPDINIRSTEKCRAHTHTHIYVHYFKQSIGCLAVGHSKSVSSNSFPLLLSRTDKMNYVEFVCVSPAVYRCMYSCKTPLSTYRFSCKFYATECTLYKIQLSFWKSLYRFTFCQRLNVYVCF